MLLASVAHIVLGWLMALISVFIILLVLVQRGRGGGLVGALGGMGGQSAFGTKAGDTFTRVTIVAASLWIVICILAVKILSSTGDNAFAVGNTNPPSSSAVVTGMGDGESTSASDDTAGIEDGASGDASTNAGPGDAAGTSDGGNATPDATSGEEADE